MSDMDMSELFAVFFQESYDHLDTMEELLTSIDVESPDDEELNAIFRAAHSIKGGAGTFGFGDVTEFTHALENLLDNIRNKEIALTAEHIDVFLEAGDIIRDMISNHENEEDQDLEAINEVQKKLQNLLEKSINSKDSKADDSNEDFGFFEEEKDEEYGFFEEEKDAEYGFFEEEKDAEYGFFEEEKDAEYGFFEDQEKDKEEKGYGVFSEEELAKNKIAEKIKSKKREASQKKVQKKKSPVKRDIRVDTEKVDKLINLVGELVITQSIISLYSKDPELCESKDKLDLLREGVSQLERNVVELQENVMGVRLMPVRTVFQKFPRVVRDLSKKLNKKIDLVIEGEETELDKGLVEKISDPLTHLVRNSLDHGIESLEDRRKAGKPEVGTISLKASYSGGSIVIEVSDDGGGLNREKIISKALDNGIDIDINIPDSEVWQLIFHPGFSTAEEVSDVSGRGVGMDVVKKNIVSMGGRVELSSVPGKGTTTSIYLPLTMAILEGMIVEVGDVFYVIPLLSILETVVSKEVKVKEVGGKDRMVLFRNEYIPIVSVDKTLKIPNAKKREIKESERIYIIVETTTGSLAIEVDRLYGQQQVVIKSLETNFRKVEGISGATILGNGSVALIIDIDSFKRMVFKENNKEDI